jgi:hypothetical protein
MINFEQGHTDTLRCCLTFSMAKYNAPGRVCKVRGLHIWHYLLDWQSRWANQENGWRRHDSYCCIGVDAPSNTLYADVSAVSRKELVAYAFDYVRIEKPDERPKINKGAVERPRINKGTEK